MEGFEWAENNLGAAKPHELQSRGVNVFFAPNIQPDTKVVNLADGGVDRFAPGQDRPPAGYYADYESLERYCRQQNLPLTETSGQISILPRGTQEAGDPIHHEGP